MNTVASIILDQIGHGALVMIGAKNILYGDNHVQMKIGRNAKSVTHITVTLKEDDTYTTTFTRVPSLKQLIRGQSVKTLAEVDGVYFDQLRPVIEKHTGLYTSL